MRRVNGYEVEEAPNGAWWVRHPGRAGHAWRFATKAAAVRFAHQRHPAVAPAAAGEAERLIPPPPRGPRPDGRPSAPPRGCGERDRRPW
jgi:hypothetical protein